MSYAEERFYEQKFHERVVIVFVFGFLMGGMLVWAFSGPSEPRGPSVKEMAVKACMDQGGIPITDGNNRLTDCKKYE